jgi:hypothetical protein
MFNCDYYSERGNTACSHKQDNTSQEEDQPHCLKGHTVVKYIIILYVSIFVLSPKITLGTPNSKEIFINSSPFRY